MASQMKLRDQKLKDNCGKLLSSQVQKSGQVVAYAGRKVDAVLAVDVVGVNDALDLAVNDVVGHRTNGNVNVRIAEKGEK